MRSWVVAVALLAASPARADECTRASCCLGAGPRFLMRTCLPTDKLEEPVAEAVDRCLLRYCGNEVRGAADAQRRAACIANRPECRDDPSAHACAFACAVGAVIDDVRACARQKLLESGCLGQIEHDRTTIVRTLCDETPASQPERPWCDAIPVVEGWSRKGWTLAAAAVLGALGVVIWIVWNRRWLRGGT